MKRYIRSNEEDRSKGEFNCLSYTLRPDIGNNSNIPDFIILTDNGAVDLEKQGLYGFYIWVGYKHSRFAPEYTKEKAMEECLPYIEGIFTEYLESVLGYEPDIEVQDFIDSTDMFRIYAAVSESVYSEFWEDNE